MVVSRTPGPRGGGHTKTPLNRGGGESGGDTGHCGSSLWEHLVGAPCGSTLWQHPAAGLVTAETCRIHTGREKEKKAAKWLPIERWLWSCPALGRGTALRYRPCPAPDNGHAAVRGYLLERMAQKRNILDRYGAHVLVNLASEMKYGTVLLSVSPSLENGTSKNYTYVRMSFVCGAETWHQAAATLLW